MEEEFELDNKVAICDSTQAVTSDSPLKSVRWLSDYRRRHINVMAITVHIDLNGRVSGKLDLGQR